MRNSEILQYAAELLERVHWCQGAMAVDRYGRLVEPASSEAVAFCSWGAITRVCSGAGVPTTGAIQYLRQVIQGLPIPEYNDAVGRTKGEVVETLYKAAALARGDELCS